MSTTVLAQTLQARIDDMQATKLNTRTRPTHPALAEILPGGALLEGAIYTVEGGVTLLIALLGAASRSGTWCGIVGLPDFGAEAAARSHLNLERIVFVPTPGTQWLRVTAALVDVLGIVVTRPPVSSGRFDRGAGLASADAARLAARLRQRGCTLIVAGPWPGAEAELSVQSSSWSGLGHGFGALAGRDVTVECRQAGRPPRTARLELPTQDGSVGVLNAPGADPRFERSKAVAGSPLERSGVG